MRTVQQATIWSQREHCAREVALGLLRLGYPADCLHRIWIVNGDTTLEQMTELENLPPVIQRPGVTIYPQRTPPHVREKKKQAICEAWAFLLDKLDTGCDTLVVEDDIVVSPLALTRLQQTAYDYDALMVAAWLEYKGRPQFWAATDTTVLELHGKPDRPIPVACGGTACVYIRAETFGILKDIGYKPTWEPNDCKHSRGLIGKDLHLWLTLYDHGCKLMVDPGVNIEQRIA